MYIDVYMYNHKDGENKMHTLLLFTASAVFKCLDLACMMMEGRIKIKTASFVPDDIQGGRLINRTFTSR